MRGSEGAAPHPQLTSQGCLAGPGYTGLLSWKTTHIPMLTRDLNYLKVVVSDAQLGLAPLQHHEHLPGTVGHSKAVRKAGVRRACSTYAPST